ncbi:Chromatin structure-remodeling complex protein rsc9, variant 2 [Basidiobolus ranarum]
MRVNLIDTINRTPEYEEFISKLEKFHKQRGTLLQKEPVLGSRKLDLCEIYKSVLARGGYDKVTSEKGWRNLTIPLNLPPTCTNSAYMMKSVYTKYLEPYEKEIYWGQPATSTQATPKAHTPRERTPSSPAPSKNVYNSASQFIPEPKRQRYEPNTRTYPYHPNSLESLHGAGQTPHYTPAAAYSNEEIHTEPGPQNRILLALKSSLPNEVDWAFNNLIVLSYKCDDTFQIDSIPGLLDAILYYFDLDSLGPDHGRFDSLFNLDTDTVCMERALQIVHVTRNLSFLGNNAQTLASHDFYLEILLRGIELPSDGKKMELRHLCLDAFENLCPYITLRNRSARFIKPLKHLVYTSDRALVLGSVHSLTRFALNESNESVLSVVDDKLIQRMFELLLIKDEELVEAAVEYLYCYSNLSSKTSLELVRHMPQKSINILIKCLTWNMENEVFKDKNVSSEHLNSHSAVPASLRNYSTQLNDPSQNSKMDNQQLSEPVTSVALTPNFNDLNEPRRTIEW